MRKLNILNKKKCPQKQSSHDQINFNLKLILNPFMTSLKVEIQKTIKYELKK